jgi:hypothetical protein
VYASINFKTKKALKEAVAAGKIIRVFEPGVQIGPITDGQHSVEGPHFPKPHMWYAQVEVVNGIITKVK